MKNTFNKYVSKVILAGESDDKQYKTEEEKFSQLLQLVVIFIETRILKYRDFILRFPPRRKIMHLREDIL